MCAEPRSGSSNAIEATSRAEGLLIGSHAPIDSRAEEVEWLEAEIQNTRNQGQCRVYGIDQVLDMAQNAHKELIALWADNADQP